MATYLVTGCAGFIGSHITDRLLTHGHRVRGLDNMSTGFSDNIAYLESHENAENFTFLNADIRQLDDCKSAVDGVDYVLHKAALGSVPQSLEQPVLYHENNVGGTLNLLEASVQHGVKTLVMASSTSVYGDDPALPKVETMKKAPISPYAVTKSVGEDYARIYTREYGLPTVNLRYFNVFGPRQNANSQYSAVMPLFIAAALANEPIHIHGDGGQTRDFVMVDNVVDASLNACHVAAEFQGHAYNIGCGGRISIKQLAETICEVIRSKSEIVYDTPRAGDVRDSQANISFATRAGILDELVGLEAGLERTVAWYREAYK